MERILQEFLTENRVIITTISGTGVTHRALYETVIFKLVYFHLSNLEKLHEYIWS